MEMGARAMNSLPGLESPLGDLALLAVKEDLVVLQDALQGGSGGEVWGVVAAQRDSLDVRTIWPWWTSQRGERVNRVPISLFLNLNGNRAISRQRPGACGKNILVKMERKGPSSSPGGPSGFRLACGTAYTMVMVAKPLVSLQSSLCRMSDGATNWVVCGPK